MADAKITELTELTTPDSTDLIVVVDTSAGTTKKTPWSSVQALALTASQIRSLISIRF